VTRVISRKRNPKSDGIPKDAVHGNHPDTPESKRDPAGWYTEQARPSPVVALNRRQMLPYHYSGRFPAGKPAISGFISPIRVHYNNL
jgi:hypothetical protein